MGRRNKRDRNLIMMIALEDMRIVVALNVLLMRLGHAQAGTNERLSSVQGCGDLVMLVLVKFASEVT